MKKTLKLLVLSLPLMAGCSVFGPAIPTTSIHATVAGQKFSLQNPKNTSITGIQFTVDTNNTASLKIDTLSSTNDLLVIDKAYAGQAAVLKQMSDGVNSILNTSIQAAGKAAK